METIEDCMTFLLGKAQQRAYQIGKTLLSPYGVTPVQYAVLHLLWKRDGQTGVELGERLRLDSATMTGLLDRLVQNGLVEKRPDAKDRRVNLIYLLQRGIDLQDFLYQKMMEAEREILKDFTADEAELLKELLSRIGLSRTKERENQ